MAGSADLLLPREAEAVPQLLRAVWDSDRDLVGEVRGRWRWRTPATTVPEIRCLLSRKPSVESISVDPDRLEIMTLDVNRPSDQPCEVLLYPVLREESAFSTIDLVLFYSMGLPKSDPRAAASERAYFRVVEALDRWQDYLEQRHPGRVVRAIDLPMPGWLRETLRPTAENCCPLIYVPS